MKRNSPFLTPSEFNKSFPWLLGKVVILTFLLNSCGVYKKLPSQETLYGGSNVEILEESAIEKKSKELLETDLLELTKPTRNDRLFGYPYRVGFYYLFETKKTKGIKYTLQSKLGQKPVFITPSLLERNSTNLKAYLESLGYFGSTVQTELNKLPKKNESIAQYAIHLPARYVLGKIIFEKDTEQENDLIQDFLAAKNTSILQEGESYNFEKIQEEHSRISLELRNKGYHFFRPDFIQIEADSSNGNHSVDLYFSLKNGISPENRKKYLINDIFIFNSKRLAALTADTVEMEADLFRGIIYSDDANHFKEKLFTDIIGFRPGSFYSSEKNNISLQRLTNLDNFQIVKNRFEVVNQLDSSLLNVYYYLSPKKQKSLQAEVHGITRSSGFTGSQFSINWQNRNLFKGAEKLNFSFHGSWEFQVGGRQEGLRQFRNAYRLGVQSELLIPRFVMPFFKLDPEESKLLPQTTLNTSYDVLIQSGLYNLNSITASLNYVWRQKSNVHEHRLTPLSLSLVRATNISEAFIEEIFLDPRLLTILENQLIPSGSYSYTYTPLSPRSKRSSYKFLGNLDFAGNLLGFIDQNTNRAEDKKGTIFGETYSQYARIDGDFRYYYKLSPNLSLANRLFAGFGIPYGNSVSLPFTRQYFSGGNNSIRAFRARGIGPGSYQRLGSITEQFLGNFTGDVKLEFNTELRQKFNNFLHFAFFVDVGNIWMYKDPFIYFDEAVIFGSDFYKQLGVGTGFGARLDFSFFIFRLDIATPVVNPSQPLGERFVLDNLQIGQRTWRQQNLIFNIAVGYPF